MPPFQVIFQTQPDPDDGDESRLSARRPVALHYQRMPRENRTRSLESLTGTGIIVDGDRQIAKVRFSLTVTREFSQLKDIRGTITVQAGERHLAEGSRLVLRLADAHEWEFITQSGNFISGEYVVIGTGRQDIIPG